MKTSLSANLGVTFLVLLLVIAVAWPLGLWRPTVGAAEPGDKEQKSAEPDALPKGAIVRLGHLLLPPPDGGYPLPPPGGTYDSSVSFLPDGTTLAMWGPEPRVVFLDTRTWKEIRHIDGTAVGVTFSPDGKIMTARKGPKDKTIRLLEVGTGKEIGQVTAAAESFPNISYRFSADSRYLAVAGGTGHRRPDDPPLCLWEVKTAKEVRQFPLHESVNDLAFSPDGKHLATVWAYGGVQKVQVQVWDVATGEGTRHLNFVWPELHQSSAVAFAPDSSALAIAGSSPAVMLCDVVGGKERWQMGKYGLASAVSVVFSPDGQMLAAGMIFVQRDSYERAVCLLEAATGGERCRFKGHKDHTFCLSFSPDGLMLGSTGGDGTAIIWDVTGRLVGPNRRVKALAAGELDGCWSDLAGADAARAWQAILALASRPQRAVPLLKEHLTYPKLDPKRLDQLLADLDDDKVALRERASKEIAALGPAAAPALRRLQAGTRSLEVQVRLKRLLGEVGEGGFASEELRWGRAVEIMEYAATPEARELLKVLSAGSPESVLTARAKSALDRLAKRPPSRP